MVNVKSKSPLMVGVESPLMVGDMCEVRSVSQNKWLAAEVTKVDDSSRIVTVEYDTKSGRMKKMLPYQSEDLRKLEGTPVRADPLAIYDGDAPTLCDRSAQARRPLVQHARRSPSGGRPVDWSVLPPATVSELGQMSGATFCVNDVEKPSSQHASTDAATLLAKKAVLSSPCPPTKPMGLVAPDSLSELPHPLLHGGVHANGFIAAVTTAFAEHRPLALRPEHIWTLVLQAVAVHVNENAEELRSRFVAHDGKLALTVRRDEFVLGAAGHDWAGVVAEFSEQIEGNTVADATKRMATDFSTTTVDEKVAGQMTVMHAMEKYFDFCMETECGFPSITLEGSAEDWHSVRRKAEDLVRASCKEEFSSWWLFALLPVLDRFAEQYEDTGTVDVQFWQSMAKVGGIGGSGGCTWLNGWYNVFFPQLKSGRHNPFCSAYTPEAGYAKEDASKKNYYAGHFGGTPAPDGVGGPDLESIPTGVLSAPVSWDYLDQKLALEFRAGFVGAEQRPDGTVAPAIGWYIQHTDYHARYVLILCSSFSLCVFACALTLFRSCVVRSLKDIADALDEGLITEEEAAAAKEQESKAYFR